MQVMWSRTRRASRRGRHSRTRPSWCCRRTWIWLTWRQLAAVARRGARNPASARPHRSGRSGAAAAPPSASAQPTRTPPATLEGAAPTCAPFCPCLFFPKVLFLCMLIACLLIQAGYGPCLAGSCPGCLGQRMLASSLLSLGPWTFSGIPLVKNVCKKGYLLAS